MVSLVILFLGITSAQSDNMSANLAIEESQYYSYEIVDIIYGFFLVTTFIVIGLRARNSQTKIRAWIASFLVFISIFLYLFPEAIEFQSKDNNVQRGLAIVVVVIALALLLVNKHLGDHHKRSVHGIVTDSQKPA
jgi:hypothetical protein